MDGLVLLEFRAQRRAILLEPLVMGVFFHVEILHVLVEICDHICAVRSLGVMVLGRLHHAVYHSIDVNMFRGFDVYIDGMRFLINLMLAIGGTEGCFRAVLILHGVRSSARMDGILRQVKRPGFDGRKIDCFFKLAAYGLGIKCIVRIISQLAVDFQLGNNIVALLFPVGVQVRPAVYRLAADIGALTLAAPELEGVAGTSRGGSVCGGKLRADTRRGETQDSLCLGVVSLIRFQRLC